MANVLLMPHYELLSKRKREELEEGSDEDAKRKRPKHIDATELASMHSAHSTTHTSSDVVHMQTDEAAPSALLEEEARRLNRRKEKELLLSRVTSLEQWLTTEKLAREKAEKQLWQEVDRIRKLIEEVKQLSQEMQHEIRIEEAAVASLSSILYPSPTDPVHTTAIASTPTPHIDTPPTATLRVKEVSEIKKSNNRVLESVKSTEIMYTKPVGSPDDAGSSSGEDAANTITENEIIAQLVAWNSSTSKKFRHTDEDVSDDAHSDDSTGSTSTQNSSNLASAATSATSTVNYWEVHRGYEGICLPAKIAHKKNKLIPSKQESPPSPSSEDMEDDSNAEDQDEDQDDQDDDDQDDVIPTRRRSRAKARGKPKSKVKASSSASSAMKRSRPANQPRFRDVAYSILRREGRPMKVKEMVDIGIRDGLLLTRGTTSTNSLTSVLNRDMTENGTNSLFVKIEAGVFALREWQKDPPKPAVVPSTTLTTASAGN